MPRKEKVEHFPMHARIRFGEELKPAEFCEQLNAIEVKLIQAPSIEEFRKVVSVFMINTWSDRIKFDGFTEEEIDTCIDELFNGEILPTGMEIINLTMSISGMDMIDTTHLIRHRLFSFSAQCHGDRDMRVDRVMVKPGIMADPEFFERYKQIVEDARRLYVDMLDSGKVNCFDVRTIMPRCFEHFYFAKATIKDWINFVRMRIDEQILPTTDNIIALKVWLEIVKQYPFLKKFVKLGAPDAYYVKQCKKGKTNVFPPSEKNDLFDWSDSMFYHTTRRDDYPGGEVYTELRDKLIAEINAV